MTNKIAWAREYLGLASHDVSELTGIPAERLAVIEAGATVSHEELDALSRLFKFSPEYLLGQEQRNSEGGTLVLPRTAAELADEDEQELEWFSQFLVAAGRRRS